MSTYFIQRGIEGPIKIGKARDVVSRLRDLQCASSEPLRLLGATNVSEGVVHRKFKKERIRGEWYQPSEGLLKYIAGQSEDSQHTIYSVNDPAELGSLIQLIRLSTGLRQSDLAQKIGSSRKWVNEIERGKERAAVGLIFAALKALSLKITIAVDQTEDASVNTD